MNNRRTLIAAVVAGALILGAAGVGVLYFVVFAGSSPQKLALTSPPRGQGGRAPGPWARGPWRAIAFASNLLRSLRRVTPSGGPRRSPARSPSLRQPAGNGWGLPASPGTSASTR